MNLSDTSLEAFSKVDRASGQQKVLAVFKKYTNLTRDEIAQHAGMLLQSCCGRVRELLDAGVLVETPAVAGKHRLRLKNAPALENIRPALPAAAPVAGATAVTPYVPGRPSMPVADARSLLSRDDAHLLPEWLLSEARDVIAKGVHWRGA